MARQFDLVIVTAANKAQAAGYRAQLKGREGFLVVPDPGDKRVGSLGATVNVLRKLTCTAAHPRTAVRLARGASKPLTASRILICHSGGDAKRTPAYAALGKAFVPMTDRRPMLDHIIAEMEKLPAKPGVTICCGDVIPYLDTNLVKYARTGVTGVAYPDGPWQAQRHGVYVTSSVPRCVSPAAGKRCAEQPTGTRHSCRVAEESSSLSPVSAFLQKPHVTRGRHLIDTGILHIDWATAEKMTKLPIAGDIYEEFPKLLLEGFAKFSVAVVPTCEFFHIGSSKELLKLLGKPLPRTASRPRPRRCTALLDAVAAPIAKLGGDNIVTNVPASYGPISLEKGDCLTSLPLKDGTWYNLHYRIENTFKEDGLWDHHDLGAKMRQIDHKRLLALRKKA